MTETTQEYKCEACHDSGYICGEYCVFCEKDRAKDRRKREKRLQQDLKPCPSCGAKNPSADKLRTGYVIITCRCGFSANSIKSWNTRAYEVEIRAIKTHADKMARLVEVLITDDPCEPISDGGHVFLDLWRHDSKAVLSAYREWRLRS